MPFADRTDAGRRLADVLEGAGLTRPVVLGIPRGGVVTAAAAAAALGADLDVVVTAKIRAPRQRELGLGAVGPDGTAFVDTGLVRTLGVDEEYLSAEIAERAAEVARRAALYRGGRDPVPVEGRSAVVVDDGVATGGTIISAVRYLHRVGPLEVVVAVPVAPQLSLLRVEAEAERVFCLEVPAVFRAVGEWYRNFDQLDDRQVIQAMEGVPN